MLQHKQHLLITLPRYSLLLQSLLVYYWFAATCWSFCCTASFYSKLTTIRTPLYLIIESHLTIGRWKNLRCMYCFLQLNIMHWIIKKNLKPLHVAIFVLQSFAVTKMRRVRDCLLIIFIVNRHKCLVISKRLERKRDMYRSHLNCLHSFCIDQ